MKVSFKSGQCGGGILETDELYSEPNEPSSVSFQVELIYRDLNAVYFDIHDIMGKQENALYCLGKFFFGSYIFNFRFQETRPFPEVENWPVPETSRYQISELTVYKNVTKRNKMEVLVQFVIQMRHINVLNCLV